MNIALVIDSLSGGGAEKVVATLAAELARRGHRPFVYCLKSAGAPATPLRTAGVTVREAQSTGCDPGLWWRLGRWLRADGIEVVHAHSSAAFLAALPAAKCLRIPLIRTYHSAPRTRPLWYARWALRLNGSAARSVIVAESIRATLPTALAARRVRFVPNGIAPVQTDRAEARRRLEQLCGRSFVGPVVLTIANLRPEKDVSNLLRAFADVVRAEPHATLVCIGAVIDPAYAAHVQQEAARLCLGDNVVFPGPVADAGAVMPGADVFCLSSRSEAMPLVLLEAMSQHVPIVATAVGGTGALRTDAAPPQFLLRHGASALLVPPEASSALAAALLQVIHDPAAASARATQAAADFRRHFTAQRMTAACEQLYAECTRKRRSVQPPRKTPDHRPNVLMLGPARPQVGGMVTSINLLMRSPLRAHYRLHRLATTRAPANAESGPLAAALRHVASLRRLARVLVNEQIRLLHIHTCSSFTFWRNLLDLAVAKLLRRKVILHIRGNRFDRFCAGCGSLGRWLIRRGCQWADAVVLLSESWRRALLPYLGDARIFVIPNAFDPDVILSTASNAGQRAKRGRSTPCRFLFLAAVTQRKGAGDLIEAARLLQRTGEPFTVTLAGPCTTAARMQWQQRIDAASLHGVVRIVDSVAGAAKARLLASTDCFVHPSHSEGLPNSVLEAGAAGLPIVATAVGAVPEAFAPFDEASAATGERPHIPLVPPHDPAALARAMRRYAEDPALRRRVGRALREHFAANYNIARLAERIGSMYEQVLAAPPPRRTRTGDDAGAWCVRHVTYPLHERLRRRPTVRELAALRQTASASPADLELDCRTRLAGLLHFAADHLPFYQALFRRSGVKLNAFDPHGELAKLPVLTKHDVRANAAGITWARVPGGLRPCSTGGTSGDTLHFHIDRVREAQPMAARLFMQGLFGVRPGERRSHLWGSPIEGAASRLSPARDRLINELLLNAFDLSPHQMDNHLARLRTFRPRLIYGYPSALALLARHIATRHSRLKLPALRLVVLTGEEVTADQIGKIRSAFGCPVAIEYGSREVGLIAHTCPAGGLHVITPHVHVEVLRDGGPAALGETGDIVCTTLGARGQPLIRYALGDIGALSSERCPCGLPFPLMRLDGGRRTGLLALPGGRFCHGAISSRVLRDEPGIVQFRTIQHALDRLEVLLVVDADFQPGSIERICARYRRLLGSQVRVDCRVVNRIPPDPSGKRRHVISAAAADVRVIEFAGHDA